MLRPWLDSYRLLLAEALLSLGVMIALSSTALSMTGVADVSTLAPILQTVSFPAGLAVALAGASWVVLVSGLPRVAALLSALAMFASILTLSGIWVGATDVLGGSASGLVAGVPLAISLGARLPLPWRTLGATIIAIAGAFWFLQGPLPALALLLTGAILLPGPVVRDPQSGPGSLWLPVTGFAVVLVAVLVLWQMEAQEQRTRWEERTARVTDQFSEQVAADIRLRIDAVDRMAQRWERRPDMPESEWRQDAGVYLEHFSGLQGLALLNADGGLRWMEGHFLGALSSDNLPESGRIARELALARETGKTRLSRAFWPAEDGAFIYMVTPVRADDGTEGVLLGLRHLGGLFQRAEAGAGPGFLYRVTEHDGTRLFGPDSAFSPGARYRASRSLDESGATWVASAWPSETLLKQERDRVGDAVLISGVLLALFSLIAMRLALLARERAVVAARNAQALQLEMQEREQAEAKRQATALRLEQTLDGLADGFLTLDTSYRVTYANRAACDMVGLRRRELVGKRLWNLFPENRAVYEPLYEHVMQTGMSCADEVHDNALNRWLDVRIYPAEAGAAVYFRDVSDARTSREQLRFQAQILEQIHEAVIGADLAGNITFWNAGAERLFGYDAGAMQGQPLRMLRPGPEYVSLRREFMEPVLAKGSHELQLRLEAQNGTSFMAMISLSLTRDAEGRATGVLAFVLDITQRVEFETDLQDALARSQIYAGRLRELGRISLELNAVGNWRRTVEVLAQEARQLLESHLCQVTVLDAESDDGCFTVVAASEKHADHARTREPVAPDWLWEHLRQSRAPVNITQRELEDDAGEAMFPRCGLGVPIVSHEGRTIGVVFCGDRYKGEFSADDEAIGVQLAQLAGAVLAKTEALDALRATEAQHREQLEFLSTVTRSVAEGIVVTDARGVIDYVNPAAKALLDRDRADLVGYRLLDLLGETEPVVKTPGEVSDAWKTTMTRHDGTRATLVFRVSQLAEGRWQDGRVLVFSEESGW